MTTVGAALVVNDESLPALVPASLDATMRKWYVVPVRRPEIAVPSDWAVVADPAFFVAVFAP